MKNKNLKKTIGLMALVFLLGLIFAVPVSAFVDNLPTISVCDFKNNETRLQVYLPFEAVKTCKIESYEMDKNGLFQQVYKKVFYIESLQAYISGIYKLSIGVLSLGAIVVIMLGGFEYVWAAGNQQKISSAKSMISGALGGLVLALLSYGLLNTINPQITSLQIKDVRSVTKITRANKCSEIPQPQPQPPKLPLEFSPVGLDPPKYVKQDKTDCGTTYEIKGAGGNSCKGDVCVPTDEVCVNGKCTKAIVAGEYNFDPGKYVDDNIDLRYICGGASAVTIFNELEMNLSSGDYGIEGSLTRPSSCQSVEGGTLKSKYYLQLDAVHDGGIGHKDEKWYVIDDGDGNCVPIGLCMDPNGTYPDNYFLPDTNGNCAGGQVKVTKPERFPSLLLYKYPGLWTQAQIDAKGITCNLNITENMFPEDWGPGNP